MTTDTIELTDVPEVYPWDPVAPYIPMISTSLIFVDATPFETFDLVPDGSQRITGLRFGELTLHIGLSGGDTEIVALTDKLIAALRELREQAELRLAEAVPA